MKSNTTGNYTIAIKGTFEEIQLEKVNERLKTQTIQLIGQRIDLRAGIYKAMLTDENFAELVCHAAEYYNSIIVGASSLSEKEIPNLNKTPKQITSLKTHTNAKSTTRTNKKTRKG